MSGSEKKKLTVLQIVGILLLVIILLNFFQGVVISIIKRDWDSLYGRLSTLLVLVAIGYVLWDRIMGGWSGLMKHKDAAKEQFEKSKGDINIHNIKDAAIFSLAWSREIYKSIPHDRKPLVKTSFILIGIAGGIVMLHLGQYGFLTLLVIAGLILAGVNLLIWVVGSERQEKDRIAIELETARKMQLSLMPTHDPEVRGFDISGCCIPAQDVGGDLFDFVWVGKGHKRLCIPIVDVSGKGMDAALTAVYTSGALVSEAQHEEDVVTVMNNLNSAIYSRQQRSRFVSLLMVALDIYSRKIEFVNAGQSKPILFRENRIEVLKGSGARFPLGVMESPHYRQEALQLQPGDLLLLYTDGVTEAMNAQEDMFGEDRLKNLFHNLARQDLSAAGMITGIKNEIVSFSGPDYQRDDLTIVIVKAI
ncbi:MAG: SpoIIE family protein phosphatase [Candidatus Aminicenantes bacterium]|nr:SpoIIE family protein phosphatase [Candidatus Aminicenantes bacterium]NIM77228.1 SpoIIE family protein phosphatase [Candidatus Aminicenantes bacterium]NIN16524.1 SpoIIE family protein phosphatase [Candidatus Aminicenantes bacterium]NIN40384.1 SpoIIE family protein phosphatase [Candidatus Aminicenantes bacterium]NIN83204.1 SpoIIE family protein phosphatase [Candidatus Aminicenantes bacterium]